MWAALPKTACCNGSAPSRWISSFRLPSLRTACLWPENQLSIILELLILSLNYLYFDFPLPFSSLPQTKCSHFPARCSSRFHLSLPHGVPLQGGEIYKLQSPCMLLCRYSPHPEKSLPPNPLCFTPLLLLNTRPSFLLYQLLKI